MTLELPSGEYDIRREGPSQHELLRALEVLHDDGTPRLVKFGVNHNPAPNDTSGGFGLNLQVQIFGLTQCGSLQSREEINCWRILGLLQPGKGCIGHTRDVTKPRLVTIYYQAEPRSGRLYVYPSDAPVPLTFDWTFRGDKLEGMLVWQQPPAELMYKPRFFALRRSAGARWLCISKERYLAAEQQHGGKEPFANGEPDLHGFEEDKGLGRKGYSGKVFTHEDDLIRFAREVGFDRITFPPPIGYLRHYDPDDEWDVVDHDQYMFEQGLTEDHQYDPVPCSFSGETGSGKVFYDQDEFQHFLDTHRVRAGQHA